MKVYLKFFLLCSLTQVLVQCGIKNDDQGDIEIVELGSAFNQRMILPLKLSFFSENQIEYIHLKTPDEININEEFLRVYADSENILLIGFRQMYLFDRKTGDFIREIGTFGEGPNGYSATFLYNAYDYSRKSILACKWDRKKFLEYDLKGNIIRNINFISVTDGEFNTVNHLENNIYVAYYNNYLVNKRKRLNLIDIDQNILKTYYHGDYAVEPRALSSGLSMFYKYQSNLMFLEMFCDTLYHVTKENLMPRFVFDLDEFDPPYNKLFDENYFFNGESKHHILINNLFESNRFVFIRFSYNEFWFWQAVYDKLKKQVLIQSDEQGIENDIDDFVPLSNVTSVNNEDELIGFTEAYHVEDWYKTHPEKVAKLPFKFSELKSLSKNDNPVIMIVKLKQ